MSNPKIRLAIRRRNEIALTGLLSGLCVLLMLAVLGCGDSEPEDDVDAVVPVATQAPGLTPTNIVPTERSEAIDISTVAPAATLARDPTYTAVAPPEQTELSGDGSWILESLDGGPIIEDSFATVEIGEDRADGYDGCNWFGGSSEDGTPVADESGVFSFPFSARTVRLCEEPSGVMEQSDAFFSALEQGETYRVAGERLEILDDVGDVRLVFVKQVPLEGRVVDMSETAWRLVEEDAYVSGGSNAATMAFLDYRLVVGDTACRPYLATYNRSDGGVHFTSQSMLERSIWQSCSDEDRRLEGEFTDFMGSIEYAVQEAPGLIRLRMRNSEGNTLTFEPLHPIVEHVADAEWVLLAITEILGLEFGMSHNRVQNAAAGADLTLSFHTDGISGSTGCNSYGAEAAVGDGSITIDAETYFYTELGCYDSDGVMEQEERYLDVLPRVTRYGVYGDYLVLQTNGDVFLLFRAG